LNSKIGLVLVVHPNYLKYLPKALDTAREQTRSPAIAVVFNGCSASEVASAQLKPGEVPVIIDATLGAARNAGTRAVDTEFVAYLDADDWLSPTMCETLSQVLDENPTIDAAWNDVWLATVGLPERSFEAARRPELMGGAMIRRSAFDAIGGFADRTRGDSVDFWNRFHVEHRSLYVAGEPLYYYRQHGENMHNEPQ
jgi:glycosyltransferase involved in cell wall biosynthesis